MTTTLMDVDVDKILRVYFLCQRDIRKLKEHRAFRLLCCYLSLFSFTLFLFVTIYICFAMLVRRRLENRSEEMP